MADSTSIARIIIILIMFKRKSKQSTVESLVLKSTWTVIGESIKPADIAECNLMQSKLEGLLSEAKQRAETLEALAKEEGLRYKGKDKVECNVCDNTFKPESKYSATCDSCCDEAKVEMCIDCLYKCQKCDDNLCFTCKKFCSGCNDTFCKSCVERCFVCYEHYCDRGTPSKCTMFAVGYGEPGSGCTNCRMD